MRNWCIAGVPVITASGSAMHYAYDWSGQHAIMGLIFPVNESVWEHLKMAYWGLFLFALCEYPWVNQKVKNYFTIKLLGLLILIFSILAIYYAYHSLLGRNVLALDILSFVVGVVLCQWASWRLYQNPFAMRFPDSISLLLFLGAGILFAWLTLHPPRKKIFWDRNTKSYGIPEFRKKNQENFFLHPFKSLKCLN